MTPTELWMILNASGIYFVSTNDIRDSVEKCLERAIVEIERLYAEKRAQNEH